MPLYRTDEFGPNASDTLSRALANQMLPTPTAADGTKMSSNPETSARRMEKGNQASLTDIVQTEMLPPGYLLPTPVAHDSTENIIGPANHRPDKEDSLSRALHHLNSTSTELSNHAAGQISLLKTPVASERGHLDRPERYLNGNEPGARFDLSDQVAALLPTPRAQMRDLNAREDYHGNLEEALAFLPGALLPTPRAQNGETRNQNIYARPLDQPQNLENAIALLPTPLCQPSKNGQIWVRPDDEFQNLENAIAHMPSVNALLPTPLASDYKQAGFQPSLSDSERSESIPVAIMNLLPTPTVMDMGSNYTPEEWEAWKLKQKEAHRNGNGHGSSLTQEAITLMGTPTALPGVRTARFRRPGENPMEFVERLNREALTGESTAEPSEDGSEYLGEPLQIQLFLE